MRSGQAVKQLHSFCNQSSNAVAKYDTEVNVRLPKFMQPKLGRVVSNYELSRNVRPNPSAEVYRFTPKSAQLYLAISI